MFDLCAEIEEEQFLEHNGDMLTKITRAVTRIQDYLFQVYKTK
jgi:hypothetical protein